MLGIQKTDRYDVAEISVHVLSTRDNDKNTKIYVKWLLGDIFRQRKTRQRKD